MIDAQQETKLRSYGFTDKNITALRAVLEDPKRKDRTLHSLLVELKRRFYTSWIIVIGLLFLLPMQLSLMIMVMVGFISQ